MTILDKLERRFGRYAIPHLTLVLISGQILVFFLMTIEQISLRDVAFVPVWVLEGEFWRIVSFLFYPPMRMHIIFMAFAWYIFFLMGSALEEQWGNFRYNVYILIAWIATVTFSFLAPHSVVTNAFLMGSVFLAFAFLNPRFELMLMLVLPVQVKWIALVVWIFYGFGLLFGEWPTRLAVAASILNFLLFFGKDLIQVVKSRQRRMAFEAKMAAEKEEPLNRCRVCGRTDRTNPDLDFRYCSKCAGSQCYCEEHLRNHEHVQETDAGD